ncbi:MAG: protein translocase subunit SecD, partial [Candidatus Yanofskybacteria bacterium]|nr:protein translocase subunit SecD [Candidatus Yanofskybacteria bacterium]
MAQRKSLAILALILFLGGTAGLFVFSSEANKGIGAFNERRPGILPALPLLPEKEFSLGLDLQGGLHLVYEADLSQINPLEYNSAMEGLRDVIERRVNLFGVSEPVVQTEGTGDRRRLIVELAGIESTAQAVQMIGQTPYLEFREPKPEYQEIVERNLRIFEGREEGEIEDPFVPTQLSGRYLQKTTLEFGQIASEPIIQLEFNQEGAQLFGEITSRTIGLPLAIFLDGQLLSAPTVQQQISGGSAQITGSFTREEARQIVRDLNAGSLPVPITILSEEHVGATLGNVSFEKSLKAGLGGLVLVGLFMLFFYKLPGLIASLSLLFYLFVVLAIVKFLGLTLTLAGIAGLVLSIGMAVDANILIFSRLREEVRQNNGLPRALEDAFHRAWPSIRDGNVTTLLVAAVLFWIGSSFVQGFALMLSLGIVLSMFSALFVTRAFLGVFERGKLSSLP